MARKPKRNNKDEFVMVRVQPAAKRRWKADARKCGENLSQFLTRAANLLCSMVEHQEPTSES